MSRELRVVPECHADTLLIDLMGFKNPNHQQGINNVAAKISEDYKNRLAIGVIDNDKFRRHKYYDGFEVEKKGEHFIFEYKPETKHFLVVMSPDFEKCMFNIASELNVETDKYGFKTVKQFKRFTKHRNVADNQNVKQFLNTLIQKKNSPLQNMQEWIHEKLKP